MSLTESIQKLRKYREDNYSNLKDGDYVMLSEVINNLEKQLAQYISTRNNLK